MSSVSAVHEPSPREKLERLKTLAVRARAFVRGALALAFVVSVAGIAVILKLPRVYESETVVLARDAIRTDPRDETPSIHAQRIGPKLKDLLLARSRLEGIVARFGLYPQIVERRGTVDAVEEMRKHVGFRSRDSDTFVISFQSQDRELAQKVTAALAQSMIDEFVRDNVDTARAARDFLVDEEKRAERDLDAKGEALAEFLANHPQYAWDPTKGAPPPFAPVAPKAGARKTSAQGPSDPELAALYRERARLEAQLDAAAAPKGTAGATPQMAELEKARAGALAALTQAQADLAEKRQRLTEEHPDVIAARNRAIAAGRALNAAEGALSDARAAAAEAARAEDDGADTGALRDRLTAVKGAILARERVLAKKGDSPGAAPPSVEASKPAPSGAVAVETEWQRLVRDVSEARNHKEDVAAKRARAELEASATATSGAMIMTVIDPAYRPTRPLKPNRTVLASMTLALSALLGILWAFARVVLDDTIFDATDVEAKGGPEVLVAIPREPATGKEVPHALVTVPPRARAFTPEPLRVITTPPPPSARASARERHTTKLGLSDAPLWSSQDSALRPTASALARPGCVALAAVPVRPDLDPPWEPSEVVAFAAPRAAFGAGEPPLVGPRAISALRILRHKIEQRAPHGRMVVAVTSARAGEGKSRVAAELAFALAESDRARVLLVEANLERPSLERLLGIEVPDGRGFSVQLRRRMEEGGPLPFGVVACGGSLHVLAENLRDPGWPGSLHSRVLPTAIDELRARYEYIVLDGPSVLDGGDATSVESVADGVILVARAGVTRGVALVRAARTLGERRLLGVVLNDAKVGS